MDVNGIGNAVNINNAYNTSDGSVTNDNVVSTDNKVNDNVQTTVQKKEEFNKKELDKAITYLNKFLEQDETHAEYSKHKDLGTIMIRIVNDKTKETILEAPPKKILDMIASLLREDGLLDKKA